MAINDPLQSIRNAGRAAFDLVPQYHETSSYWNIPAASAAYTIIEGLKIGFEKLDLPQVANALGTINGSAGIVGIGVDVFKLWEVPDKPYVSQGASIPSRLFLAAAAGTIVGCGLIPDPTIHFGPISSAALRRSVIESIGYSLDGHVKINPHTAMIASGVIGFVRSFLPYFGNPPPFIGSEDIELAINASADIIIEMAWEFIASLLAVGIDRLTEGATDDEEIFEYSTSRLIATFIPPFVQNIYSSPVRLHEGQLTIFREISKKAGFNLDIFFSDKVAYRKIWLVGSILGAPLKTSLSGIDYLG
ncbi:MAG: hypothetical protein A3I05_02510 [Deltaproteobacteria bacterium RIFCSPLOWO2_02_FULL_44_10]|nr:MAG: hypothetical protein A3I05_02510 [Deltaproteobacteria bacterium RIFCSPLOWO2_02_FULL_44_10]